LEQTHFLHAQRQGTNAAVAESMFVEAARCRTAVERALPAFAVEIYINRGTAGRRLFDASVHAPLPRRGAWVIGPRTKSLLVEKEVVDCDIVSVRLRPGVVQDVLGVPPRELAGSLIDLEDLWSPSAVDRLREQLSGRDGNERLDIVEQAVDERAGIAADAGLAHRVALDFANARSVAVVADRRGMSHRSVIELSERFFGMKPKAFQRVQRLRRVLQHVHRTALPDWASIAQACGFFDQSHLINDFREQAGITPSQYADSRSSVGRGFAPFRLAARISNTADPDR